MRTQYNLAMLEYLQGQGTAVTIAEYGAEAQEHSESTALYQLLLKKGVVSNQKAFMALREESGVRVLHPPVPQVIQACHEAGGIAVVAHPGHDTGVVSPSTKRISLPWKPKDLTVLRCSIPRTPRPKRTIMYRLQIAWDWSRPVVRTCTYPARSLKKWSAARIATGMRCSNTWNASPL